MRLLSISRSEWRRPSTSKGSWTRLLAFLVTRRKGRRTLAVLDDHLLQDIGLTRSMAMDEADKPFWRD